MKNRRKKFPKSKRAAFVNEVVQDEIESAILTLLDNAESPLSEKTLYEKLNPKTNKKELQKVLEKLAKEGHVEKGKKGFSRKRATHHTITGTLQLHPRGFGFVTPEKKHKSADIFIPKHLVNGAVDGDLVEVDVHPIVSKKGPEGRISKVIKRGRTHLAGTILDGKNGRYEVFAPLMGKLKKVILIAPEISLKRGDRIIMKVTDWNTIEKTTEGTLKCVIGPLSDPSFDIPAAVEEFEIVSSFSDNCLKEAKKRKASVETKDLKGREDLTGITTITIDPETAKDYDDAISITRGPKGEFELGVHIADVAYYIKPGSFLDKEAYLRGNSTYFPGKCIPMLPEELSNGLCSLKPDVIRLTVSVFISLDKSGNLKKTRISRSYIKSEKRFTYREAKEVLDKKIKSPLLPLLEDCRELGLLLKKKRMERGSIDFALPDAVLEVNEKGEPIKIRIEEYDITHQFIEEFMLKANEVVGISIANKGKTPLYRIHEEPSPENFKEFFAYAKLLGFSLPKEPTQQDIQKLFLEAKNTPQITRLSVAFIRSMKIALYSPENIGHYGLALEHYVHFTSPIRRYSDLVIQRLLFDEEPEDENLDVVANVCSQRERISMRAEESVTTLKKLRLLEKFQKNDPNKIFAAEITKVKPYGIHFELKELLLEGSLHVSELGNDFYHYNNLTQSFKGERTGKIFGLGQPISIKLVSIDFILQEAKYAIVKK